MPPRQPGQPFRRLGKNGQASYGPRRGKGVDYSAAQASPGDAGSKTKERLEATRLANHIDETMGFFKHDAGKKKVGWLCNMHSSTVPDDRVPGGRAGVDYYFIADDGSTFKATVEYSPYFLIAVKRGREAEVEEWCRRAFEGLIKDVKRIEREDLNMVSGVYALLASS